MALHATSVSTVFANLLLLYVLIDTVRSQGCQEGVYVLLITFRLQIAHDHVIDPTLLDGPLLLEGVFTDFGKHMLFLYNHRIRVSLAGNGSSNLHPFLEACGSRGSHFANPIRSRRQRSTSLINNSVSDTDGGMATKGGTERLAHVD
jgi:hypothetical protein